MRQSPVGAALAAATVVLCVGVGVLLPESGSVGVAASATLLLVGVNTAQDGVVALVGWLLAGAVLGGAIGYAAVELLAVPLTTGAVVGLGVALGGGLGVLTNLLVLEPERSREGETVEVEMEDESVEPRPADLFDGHPDPVLYVADDGHGPVVRAANAAYGRTFDLPTDAVVGAPVDEVLMCGDSDEVADSLEDSRSLDVVVDCETPDGDRQFRLRVAGDGDAWYLVYTPVEW